MPQQTARRAARDSWKPQAQRQERVALPAPQARQVLRPLQEACSAKAVAVVVEVLLVLVARAVLEAVALAAAVAVLAAAHTRQVLAGLVGVVGLWYWSFDHAAICRC